MASKDQSSVVRRSIRGRTGIDAKTKTDSGCFVDDDVEKQTQIDKSPPGKKGESKFVKIKAGGSNESISDKNKINTFREPLVNRNSQNAVVEGGGEMSQSYESLNNEDTHDDSLSSRNKSIDDTKPKEDFYCLYYSDSPNGSLTRNKDKKGNSTSDYDHEDLAARAEVLLEKVKSEALRSSLQSPDTAPSKVEQPSTKRKAPPVAPKPKRNPKQNGKSSKDPILDELDKLGASVGRDFSNVNENTQSLFSNAVKELQVAQTPEECIDRFDAIQSALLEDVPDTLERKRAKSAKEDLRRKSFPGADKAAKSPVEPSKNGNLETPDSKLKTNKQVESPKPAKQKFEVKKLSRTEKASLHLMKADSHKRSHLKADNGKPLSTRSDAYKSTKTDASKRLVDRIESNKVNSNRIESSKVNSKKEKKTSPPPSKGAKISPKVDISPKDENTTSNKNGAAKRNERLEFRSGRRRLNGDLTSIPEDAVVGTKIDRNKVIPLAKAEDDLSSEEDDFDQYEEETFEGTSDLSYEGMDLPPPPPTSTSIESSTNSTISKEATLSITGTANVFEKETVTSSSSFQAANRISSSKNKSLVSHQFESTKALKPSSELHGAQRQYSTVSSDGWTLESTVGYSSANDADDETERQLETSEDFETYEDPQEIVDMTFGDGIEGSEEDRYVYFEEAPRQLQRTNVIVDRRMSPSFTNHFQLPQQDEQPTNYPLNSGAYAMEVDVQEFYEEPLYVEETPRQLQRKQVIVDRRISPSFVNHFQPQQEGKLSNSLLQSGPYPMESDAQEVYEPVYYENEGEAYYQNYDDPNLIDPNVTTSGQIMSGTRNYHPGLDSYEQEDLYAQQDVVQRPRTNVQEEGPDPSGFMTVQDIKRLIFQGRKPSIPRSSSFCGTPSSSTLRRSSQQHDSFQRQSWSGYSARQQQEPGVDPLVRKFPQNNPPLGGAKTSPYVRTVVQKSSRQPGYFSDSNLTAVIEKERGHVGRSQSFSGAPLQRRTHSLDNYHLDVVSEEGGRGRRSRSFCAAPMQRRANSLDGYYSSNRVSTGSQRSVPSARQLTRQHRGLARSNSDSSSDYSQSDNEQYNEQFHRTNGSSRGFRNSQRPQYIDAQQLAELMSPHSTHEVRHSDRRSFQPPQCQYNSLQHGHHGGHSTFPRKSSESLRIQAIRRASQSNSDVESDVYAEKMFTNPPNMQPSKQLTVAATKPEKPAKTLSERFSDTPQRVSFEDLAEQLNLPIDDEDDIAAGGFISRPESECGADLEFDFGDYFDDKSMIVGEALRLKKVLGCDTEQDPELQTIVSAVTDPKVLAQINQCRSVHMQQANQTDEYLTPERPPPYHEVRKEMKSNARADSPNYCTVYDTDGSYPSESEYSDCGKPNKLAVPLYAARADTTNSQRRDSETPTWEDQLPATEKAMSAEELLKLLLNSSQGSLNQNKSDPRIQQKQSTVLNTLFPAPQTKAASTGNIHSEKTFPGHVCQLYGNPDVNGDRSTLNRRRHHTPPPPTYHKSQECLRRGRPASASAVLKAKLVSSSENVKHRSSGSSKRVFEEEVDCMKTKGIGDFSSGEISSGSSLDDIGEKKGSPFSSVSYVGCEETKQIETLPRVKLSSQRKRRKEKVGYLSDQDIPKVVQNTINARLTSENSSDKLAKDSTRKKQVEPQNVESEKAEKVVLRKKAVPKINLREKNSAPDRNGDTVHVVNGDQIVRFPHDDLPSPNSVNVFIDYKKNVMKVTTSTPKIHHGKLITESPTGVSPVAGSPNEERKASPPNAGQEEFPPRYDSGSSSERSSSVYSSDEEKFFGSSDTVVFVDKTTESQSDKPNVDVTLHQDQGACASNGYHSNQDDDAATAAAKTDAYSARVDSLLQEVRSSLDLDSIGSDLLDQAMERVKDKLSPRSSSQATGGLTMEAYVALHQADELQAIINEIKCELQILQEENSMLKEKVVSLQLGDSCSTSETTEDSLTESAERIESIRKQIAAVVVNKQQDESIEEEDHIVIDVFLRGFGATVGLKTPKTSDVKLGEVTVKGGADWTGVYDAAKTTFLDHIRRIDTASCLGLGPTSMYGAQIGATMLTPDGMTDSYDTLIYDTLIPKPIIESFVHQILENRFVMLCGCHGIGKSHLATKLAEHLAQRFGSKTQSAVLTLSVGEKSRKELKRTLADLMKCDISTPSDEVPVVVILDQLDCLASLADIFEPKQLDGNRNSPFIIGVRNKSKKGPFSSKDLAIHKYFRWIQMSVYDRYVLGLLERFLRRKLSWSENVESEEDLLDLFIWLTQVWQRINQILLSYIDVEATMGPSVFYTCPLDIHAAEGWFANVWNYTIIPYLHQNIRNSRKIYDRDVPWEDPTKWVIMRWPWSRERSKVLPTLKKLRQVDIVLNRNNMESSQASKKESYSKTRKLRSNLVQTPSKAGSLESWSTADWETASQASEGESIPSSTL